MNMCLPRVSPCGLADSEIRTPIAPDSEIRRSEQFFRPPGAVKAPLPLEKSASEKIFHTFEDIFNPRPPFFRYFCEWKTYISQTKNK